MRAREEIDILLTNKENYFTLTSFLFQIQMMSAQILLFPDLSSFKPDVIAFDYDEIFSHQHLLPDRFVIEVSSSQDATVVIYNSLTYARSGDLLIKSCLWKTRS